MRIAKWDNAKFLLIYCVVLGHLFNAVKVDSAVLKALHLFIYSFHMPAFLYISGLFSKRTVEGRKIEKAALYLVLYIFMVAFRLVVYSLVNGKWGTIHLFTESGVVWFGLTLFLCYVVTMMFCRFKAGYLIPVALGVGILAGFDKNLGDFLTGMRFLTMYPFFVMGYCTPVDRLQKFTQHIAVRLAGLGALAGTFYVFLEHQEELGWLMTFFKGKASYEEMEMLPMGAVYRGAYYIAAMVLVISVIAIVPSFNSIIATWGSRSIQVFALHFPLIVILQKKFNLMDRLAEIKPDQPELLLPVVALALTVVLSLFIWEPFFKWLMHPAYKAPEVPGAEQMQANKQKMSAENEIMPETHKAESVETKP